MALRRDSALKAYRELKRKQRERIRAQTATRQTQNGGMTESG